MTFAVAVVACGSDPHGGDTTDPDGQDSSLGSDRYPIADIHIEYTNDDATISYDITCLGDTATLTGDAPVTLVDRSACEALGTAEVQDRLLGRDVDPDRTCSAQFGGNDRAVITGRIDDQPVDTSVGLRNGCEISEWTDLLGDLLPRPLGN